MSKPARLLKKTSGDLAAFGQRVRQVREGLELNQDDFGKRVGSSSGHISQIETGKTEPKYLWTLNIASEFGLSLDWLLTGEGEMRREPGMGLSVIAPPSQERVVYEGLPEDVLRIPIYDLSAGGGLEPNGELVESRGDTVRRWLREEVGINPDDAFLARVMGDSMVPVLYPGDLALGLLGDEYRGEGVYALWFEDEFYVKTVERRGSTKVRLLSKNPDYEPIFVHEGDKIRLLGRVLRRFTGLY